MSRSWRSPRHLEMRRWLAQARHALEIPTRRRFLPSSEGLKRRESLATGARHLEMRSTFIQSIGHISSSIAYFIISIGHFLTSIRHSLIFIRLFHVQSDTSRNYLILSCKKSRFYLESTLRQKRLIFCGTSFFFIFFTPSTRFIND